jgi:hypothetical protein
MRYFMIAYSFRDNMFGYGIHFMESENFPDLVNFSLGTDQQLMVMNVIEFSNSRDYKSAQGIQ